MLILLPGLALLIASYFFAVKEIHLGAIICFIFALVLILDSSEHIKKIYYPEQTQTEVKDDV